MPSGSYWPAMSAVVEVWKGDETPTGIQWNSNNDTYAVYRSGTDWNGRGFRRSVSSTCRESLSIGLKEIGTAWSLLFKDNFDRDIHKRITLDIHKRPPSAEWMTAWKSLWVFPDLITRYTFDEYNMRFVLNNNYIAMGAPQPMFSFPFFFTNRHEAFTPDTLADPDKVVKQLLHDDEGYWGRSSQYGEMSFSHAFAAFVMNIANNKQAFYRVIDCNGVGQYVLYEMCKSYPKLLSHFVNKYKVDVNKYMKNASSYGSMTVPQIINAMSASIDTVTNPTTW